MSYITGAIVTGRLLPLLVVHRPTSRKSAPGRRRIITIFGKYLHVGTGHSDFDLPVRLARGGAGDVAERVLVAGFADGARVRLLDRVARHLGKEFSGRSVGVAGQNVAEPHTRQMQLLH